MAVPQTPPRKASPSASPPRVVIAPTPPQTPHEKRAEGLSGWAQLGAAILFQVPALRPDAAVVAHYGPAFAEEAANLADEDERAAALLDKISGMGPYAALVSILAQAGMQVAVNHGFMRPGFMGTLPPEEFVTVVTIDKFVGESDDKPPTARSTTT